MPMNLNIDPYYDDYDYKKGFHKILFKPGVAVQARELTQIQSLLQNQITKFANHIFEDGSVVSDANHTIDFNVSFFKIDNAFNSGSIVFNDDLIGKTIVVNNNDLVNPDNRKFFIKAITQQTTKDPKTIYATLMSGGSAGDSSKFVSNSVRLDVYASSNPVIGTDTSLYSYTTVSTGTASGTSILFGIDEGVFYSKNSFVFCPQQTLVVSKYSDKAYTGTITASTSSTTVTGVDTAFLTEVQIGDSIYTSDNKLIGSVDTIIDDTHLTLKQNSNTLITEAANYNVPLSAVIGLKTVESIITSDTDSTLLDPSFGSYNYAAPGADRYFISLQAVALSYHEQSLQSEDFIDICHIKDGVVESDQRLPVYSNIAETFARRTYDESGNYIVNGLLPTVKANPDESLLTLNVAAGKAYVKGYEIEKNGVTSIELTKPRTYTTALDYTIPTQYGNYITVNSLAGSLPDIAASAKINLYSISDTIIGSARVINLIPVSYGSYKLYLDDVILDKSPISDVTHIIEITGKFSANLTESKITDTNNRLLVFSIPLGNIKTVNGASYTGSKLYKSVPIYGGVCSITSDSLTRDFVPSSGSENNINYTIALTTLSSGEYTLNSILDLSAVDITVDTNPDTNSSASFNFHDSSFNGLVDIIATLNISGAATRTRTLVPNYGKIVSFGKDEIKNQSLGVSDINKFVGAFDAADKIYQGMYDPLVSYGTNSVVIKDGKLYDILGTTLGTTAYENIGSKFVINDGQTDSFFGNGSINRKSDFSSSISVLVIFDYYIHSGDGPIVVNNVIGSAYSNIGLFSDSVSFSTYKLRNCLDFRPVEKENNTGFSNFILPHGNAIIDVDYYLGRIDKVFIDKTGKLDKIEGIPARQPKSPASNPDAMDLCSISYEPYTDNETSLKLTLAKNKRYTMKDIGDLEGRIENVEYYTSLSMLEKETSSKTFTDDNGVPLFNNGFLVDSFQGKNVADVTNPDMRSDIDYDKNELRPRFFVKTAHANLTTTGTGINENTISLPYTSTKLTGVSSYSSTVSVNPYNVITSSGSATLTPDTDHWVKELLPVNDSETISKLAGSSDIMPVTVWNAWDPKGVNNALSTSAVTSANSDFVNIATSQNKIVNGTTYNFTKNIIPVTRERVIQFKVSNMLPDTILYYFFGNELQLDGFVTDETGSTFLSVNPSTDSSGNATGYIVIPSGKEGSTFVITFCNTPSGKAYSSSFVSVNYYVDMAAKYADVKPISIVTGDQIGEATITELKVPKPTATYTIEPTSYVISEGQTLTFKFKAQNYDLKGNFIGNVVTDGGNITFTNKSVNGTVISSLSSFEFNVDSDGIATINLTIADDGVSQPERKITLSVTINNKSNRTAAKYPEFLFGSIFSNSVKVLNPIKTEYSVVAPVSVGVNDMLNVTFQSNNAEADIPISYKVYRRIGTSSEVDVTSSFTSPSNPFNTSNANPIHTIVRDINQDSSSGETLYKDKNGNYRFVFTDNKGNSKESNVKVNGFFDTKYYNLSNNSFASNVKQGSTVTFTLDTNHYTTNPDIDTIPFVITSDGVDISTLGSQYTVSPSISSFTGTVKSVSVTVSNSVALTKTKLLKLELTGSAKGKGSTSVCYIQNNSDDVTITADKTAYASIGDNQTINFTVTSSYGSAAAGFKVSGIAVSNLSSNEYTLSATSGVLNSSGSFSFSLTGAALRTARVDKIFAVSLLYNNANTITSSPYTLASSGGGVPGSSGATAAVVFRNDANTADVTNLQKDINTGVFPPVKLKITLTGVKLSETFTVQIAAPLQPGVPRQMSNTMVFDVTGIPIFVTRGIYNIYDVYSLTLTGQQLLDNNYLLPVKFSFYCPENYELLAEVKAVTRDELVGTANLLLQKPSNIFTIASDRRALDVWSTATYTVKTPNEKVAKTLNWSITLGGSKKNDTNKANYFDAVSGTVSLPASSVEGGASVNIPLTRNGTQMQSPVDIMLTVADQSGVTLTGYNWQTRMCMISESITKFTNITFYDENGNQANSLNLSDKLYPCKVEIYAPLLLQGDKLSYAIGVGVNNKYKPLLDLFTTNSSTSPVPVIEIKDQILDSNKKVSTTFWIKKNMISVAKCFVDVNVKSYTHNSITKQLTSESANIDVLTTVTSTTVQDSLSLYRKYYTGETAFSILTGEDYNLFVDTTFNITATDKVYLAVSPHVANTTTLSTSNFTIKYGVVTVTGVSTKPYTSYQKFNDILNSNTTLLYDVTGIASDRLINFKLNSGSITANDKVNLLLYIVKDASTTCNWYVSPSVIATLAPAAVKSYTPSAPLTIFNGKSSTMEFSPMNFTSGDTHTLKLPLSGLTLANDVNVTVNGTQISAISSTGVLTPSVTLSGNNKVTISVTSKSSTSGTIDAVINNVADSTITSTTHIDTNKGITIEADKTVNEAQYWEVNVTPRLTDTTYQVGVFDYSSGSYVAISGITYTKLDGTTLTPSSNLITFNSSNLSANNVAKFKYNIPTGFNPLTDPKACRIKFVGSDGTEVFYPISVNQTAAKVKSFIITNDSSSANAAKKEGDIVTFTVTPTNQAVTDTFDYTVETNNGRTLNVVGSTSPFETKKGYNKSFSAVDNTIKVQLDTNSVINQTTEILLTLYPKDTAYVGTTTSKGYIVNVFTSHQTIEFTDIDGTPITEVKDGEFFIVSGYNNVELPSSTNTSQFNISTVNLGTSSNVKYKNLNYPTSLVAYVETLDTTVTTYNPVTVSLTPSALLYSNSTGGTFKFKFRAIGNGSLYDANYNGVAEFYLNGGLVKKSINIKEGTIPATINITQNNSDVYETDGSVTFTIDTSLIDSGTNIPFTLVSPNSGITIKTITFTDANDPNAKPLTFTGAAV